MEHVTELAVACTMVSFYLEVVAHARLLVGLTAVIVLSISPSPPFNQWATFLQRKLGFNPTAFLAPHAKVSFQVVVEFLLVSFEYLARIQPGM